MPTVNFQGNSGKTFAKKRRRMPGTNKSFKPEMKYYDALTAASGADVFTQHTWINLLSSSGSLPSLNHYSWNPFKLDPPQLGTGVNQRNGKNYLLRFLKFKGVVRVYPNVDRPINWRLCLIRIDDKSKANVIMGRSSYLDYFRNADTTHSSPANVADAELFTDQNYYFKLKIPEVSNEFRRKVIASGTIPATYKEERFYWSTIAGASPVNTSSGRAISDNTHNEIKGLYPIDVSVTVNDNVDTDIVSYYIILETDCGYGYDISEVTVNARKDLEYDNRQFEVNFFCKAYFQDY